MKQVRRLRSSRPRRFAFDILIQELTGVDADRIRVRLCRMSIGKILGDVLFPEHNRLHFTTHLHAPAHTPLLLPKHVQLVVQGKAAPTSMLSFFDRWVDLVSFDLDVSLLTRSDGDFVAEIPLKSGPISLLILVKSHPLDPAAAPTPVPPLRRSFSAMAALELGAAAQTGPFQEANKGSTSTHARELIYSKGKDDMAAMGGGPRPPGLVRLSPLSRLLSHKNGGLPGLTTDAVVESTTSHSHPMGEEDLMGSASGSVAAREGGLTEADFVVTGRRVVEANAEAAAGLFAQAVPVVRRRTGMDEPGAAAAHAPPSTPPPQTAAVPTLPAFPGPGRPPSPRPLRSFLAPEDPWMGQTSPRSGGGGSGFTDQPAVITGVTVARLPAVTSPVRTAQASVPASSDSASSVAPAVPPALGLAHAPEALPARAGTGAADTGMGSPEALRPEEVPPLSAEQPKRPLSTPNLTPVSPPSPPSAQNLSSLSHAPSARAEPGLVLDTVLPLPSQAFQQVQAEGAPAPGSVTFKHRQPEAPSVFSAGMLQQAQLLSPSSAAFGSVAVLPAGLEPASDHSMGSPEAAMPAGHPACKPEVSGVPPPGNIPPSGMATTRETDNGTATDTTSSPGPGVSRQGTQPLVQSPVSSRLLPLTPSPSLVEESNSNATFTVFNNPVFEFSSFAAAWRNRRSSIAGVVEGLSSIYDTISSIGTAVGGQMAAMAAGHGGGGGGGAAAAAAADGGFTRVTAMLSGSSHFSGQLSDQLSRESGATTSSPTIVAESFAVSRQESGYEPPVSGTFAPVAGATAYAQEPAGTALPRSTQIPGDHHVAAYSGIGGLWAWLMAPWRAMGWVLGGLFCLAFLPLSIALDVMQWAAGMLAWALRLLQLVTSGALGPAPQGQTPGSAPAPAPAPAPPVAVPVIPSGRNTTRHLPTLPVANAAPTTITTAATADAQQRRPSARAQPSRDPSGAPRLWRATAPGPKQ